MGIEQSKSPIAQRITSTDPFYGILVDVSGSMESALTTDENDFKLENKHVNRAHAVFDTIFKTIKENTHHDDQNEFVFALAFGLTDARHQHCDLFGLFEHLSFSYGTKSKCIQILNKYGVSKNHQKYIKTNTHNNNRCQIIGHEPLIEMLKQNGAPYIDGYIKRYLSKEEAGKLFMQFHHQTELIPKMIDKLPNACKTILSSTTAKGFEGTEREKQGSKEAIETAGELILSHIYNLIKVPRSRADVARIVDRLSSLYDEKKRNDDDDILGIDELLSDIKRYIFGGTPMCKSLKYAQRIFELNTNKQNKRRLLIISDGDATDENPIPVSKRLRDDSNVTIICCFITSDNITNPKQLYDAKMPPWTEGAKNLFEMASFISNTDSSLSILLKNGWELAPSGQSKLFIQANHPEIIEQFCGIFNHVANYNDAIIDMIGHYDFDKYINNKISHEKPPHQQGGTCYANAAAMGIHLAMYRIIGRDGGYPDFYELRKKMIIKYGTDGAQTETVIADFTKQHRLHYQKVTDENKVRKIITRRRALVAKFRLSHAGWDNFSNFFHQNKKGILTRNDMEKQTGYKYFKISSHDIKIYTDKQLTNKSSAKFKYGSILKGDYRNKNTVRLPKQYGNKAGILYCRSTEIEQVDGHSIDGGGHAVVLVRSEPNCLVLMNSWGTLWGDKGFFRIRNMDVLYFKSACMKYFDIYWTLNDLSVNEKNAYKQYCRQKTKDFVNNNASSGLFELNYKCPHCNILSKINEYSGDFVEAICPKCRRTFKPNAIGLIRSLYDRQLHVK